MKYATRRRMLSLRREGDREGGREGDGDGEGNIQRGNKRRKAKAKQLVE